MWHAKTGKYCPVEGPVNGVVRFGKFDEAYIHRNAKTSEYCPEEGSVNGVVRFGKFDEAYIQRNLFLPRQLL